MISRRLLESGLAEALRWRCPGVTVDEGAFALDGSMITVRGPVGVYRVRTARMARYDIDYLTRWVLSLCEAAGAWDRGSVRVLPAPVVVG